MTRYPKRSRPAERPNSPEDDLNICRRSNSPEDDLNIWVRERLSAGPVSEPIVGPEEADGERPAEFLETRLVSVMRKNGISTSSLMKGENAVDLPPTLKKSKQRRITYENDVDNCIPPMGFTKFEYKTIFSHMYRCDFEYYEPLSKKQRRMKAYLDQIRETRGYGVTTFEPPERTYSRVVPIAKTWKKDRMLKFYIPSMVETLRVAMENKFRVRFRNMEQELVRNLEVAENLELTNVVECSNVRVYLLSFGTPKLPADGNVVEAMFSLRGGPVVGKPVASPTNFVLKEWKLKRGEHLVYSSTLTSGGMKMFSLRCNTAIRSSRQAC